MGLRKWYSTILALVALLTTTDSLGDSIDITIQSGYSCSFERLGIGMARGDVVLYHSTAQGHYMINLGQSTALGLWTAAAAANYARSRAPIGTRFTLQRGGTGNGSYVQFDGRKNAILRRWTCYGSFAVIPPPLQCQVGQIRPIDLGTVNVGESVTRNGSTPITITCNAPATTSASIQTLVQLEGQAVELTIAGKTLGLKPTVIARAVSSTTVDIGAIIRDKSFSSVGVKSAHTVLVLTFE